VENRIKLTSKEYNELCNYIYDLTGLFLGENKKDSVENKILKRMKENSIKTFKEYINMLKNAPDKKELKEFIDLLTVNETYFYRNMPQFKTFQDKILPLLLKNQKNKTLRIWSAGCSIGCEPYTIAIILKETIPEIKNWNIYILANDISGSALKVARDGLYTPREVKEIPFYLLSKYFVKKEKYYQIKKDIKDMVDIQEFNLMDFNKINSYENFDVIFCRNVLIYFDEISRKKLIDKFYDKLNIPGYIFLGHSESLNRISKAFILKRLGGDLVYVKE